MRRLDVGFDLERWRLGERVPRYAATTAAVAALTAFLVPLREHLSALNIGFLYLLLVVLIAARWGWGPARFASVAANLSFNYFFQEPLYQLNVRDFGNVLELLVFLSVAALTSALLARARAGEAAARRREREARVLYELSRLIITETDRTAALSAICRRVRDTFGAESCDVLLREGESLTPMAWSGAAQQPLGTADERQAANRALREARPVSLGPRPGRGAPRIVGLRGRRAPVVYLPMRVGDEVIGVLRVAGRVEARSITDDEMRLLQAFADQAALAADRARLLHEAAQAEALHEASRLKSALLAAVSHDLRTPLAAIKASVSSLLQPDMHWDPDTQRELLAAVNEETDRLTRLVSDLLDLSRIEGGALRPDLDWYDVTELVETVVARMEPVARAHRLEIDVAPDTGAARLDYVQIGQVIANLIENAAKYAPAGTAIRVGARRLDGAIEVSVSDQGPGIPLSERERVFDKFYRAPHAGRAAGTGLGLAICKGLVEAHGGRIWVEDAPTGGARFVFTLPVPAPVPIAGQEPVAAR
jgi:two-component system sensor histidine kinase KdpD